MSGVARKLRRRSEREPKITVVMVGVLVPDEIFPWERELLAEHIPELVHAVLEDLESDEQGQDRDP